MRAKQIGVLLLCTVMAIAITVVGLGIALTFGGPWFDGPPR